VVEVDEMRTGESAVGNPQDVAGVAVAVQAKHRDIARAREACPHAGQRLSHDASVCVQKIRGYEAVREQPVAWLLAEACDVQPGGGGEAGGAAQGVDAADVATEPLAGVALVEIRRAAAA